MLFENVCERFNLLVKDHNYAVGDYEECRNPWYAETRTRFRGYVRGFAICLEEFGYTVDWEEDSDSYIIRYSITDPYGNEISENIEID